MLDEENGSKTKAETKTNDAQAEVAKTEQVIAPIDHKNKEIDELKKKIDDERRNRAAIIDRIRRERQRLAYKKSEQLAISKLAEISKASTKNIDYLRRRKEGMEFRIATEAFTLEAEKDLIRKKNEIEKELEEALKSYRIRKKAGFIIKDIEVITKELEKLDAQFKESEGKLDVLFDSLRKHVADTNRRRPRPIKKTVYEPRAPEFSLADIAIIKDKKEEKESSKE